MLKKILTYIAVFMFFALKTLWAQEYKAEAHLSKNKILIGDTLSLTLSAEVPEGTKIEMPFFTDTIMRGVEILDLPKTDSIFKENKLIVRQKYVISAYDSAVYRIEGQPIVVHRLNSKQNDTIFSNSLTLIVGYQYLSKNLETKIDTTGKDKIIRAKENIQTPFTFDEFWAYLKLYAIKYWYIWSILAILLAGFLYWALVWRKKNSDEHKIYVPKIEPHFEAYQSLDKLKEKKLWQSGQHKEFYSELTGILRYYLERRYNIRALEEISSDIVRQVQYRADIPEEAKNNMANLLGVADYVKFAKLIPEPGENEKNFKAAYEFVKQTIPVVTDSKAEEEKQAKTAQV